MKIDRSQNSIQQTAAPAAYTSSDTGGASLAPPPLQFKTAPVQKRNAEGNEEPNAAPDLAAEKRRVADLIAGGKIRVNTLTNDIFFARHPELNRRRLTGDPTDADLRAEWISIRDSVVKSVLDRPQPEETEAEEATQEHVEENTRDNSRQNENVTAETPTGVLTDGAQQVMYELIAHGFAYTTTFDDSQKQILNSFGYQDRWKQTISDQTVAGFFAGSLEPTREGLIAGRKKVVAFRGSELGNQLIPDWLNNDMDAYAVGYTAFMKHAVSVGNLLAGAGKTVVTGHSLGGSLAKQAALLYPDLIDTCITFQAPGINPEQAAAVRQRMANGQYVPRTVTHSAQGDIVHLAGAGRIPGQESHHHHAEGFLESNTPLAHTLYLLSSEEYNGDAQTELLNLLPPEVRNTLQQRGGQSTEDGPRSAWRDVMYGAAGINDQTRQKNDPGVPIAETQAAHELRTTAYVEIENLRRGIVSHNLHPNAAIINDCTAPEIQNMPLHGRINIMRELMHKPDAVEIILTSTAVGGGLFALLGGGLGAVGGGVTGGLTAGPGGVIPGAATGGLGGAITAAPIGAGLGTATGVVLAVLAQKNDWQNTQQAILHLLRSSSGRDKVDLINAVGGIGVLADRLHSGYHGVMRDILTSGNGYYPALSTAEGAWLINGNLGGGFFGIGNDDQELIIADVLLYNADGRGMLSAVGNGDYDAGLERVLRVLQGDEDRRVSSRFRFINRERGWFW